LTYASKKYDFVIWDNNIPNIWKNKKRSKPSTSMIFIFLHTFMVEMDPDQNQIWPCGLCGVVAASKTQPFKLCSDFT
jgi:hypothetical protein